MYRQLERELQVYRRLEHLREHEVKHLRLRLLGLELQVYHQVKQKHLQKHRLYHYLKQKHHLLHLQELKHGHQLEVELRVEVELDFSEHKKLASMSYRNVHTDTSKLDSSR